MRILISGATGFLGRFLTNALKKKGEDVVTFGSSDCDLTLSDSLNQFNGIRFDQIYHLAAWTQAGDFCLKHPGEQWIMNQKINTHMLDWWCKEQREAKLIAMGTSCGYDPTLPLEEDNYLKGCPIDSLFTYAMTKRMLLNGLLALHKQYGLNFLYVVPSTLYGPGYHTDDRQLHFIFDLMRKILLGKYEGETVVLWGNGEQKRELVHIDDFVNGLLMLSKKVSNTLLNIGAGEEYSIKEFAQILCRLVDYPFEKIKFDTNRYVGATSKVLNISRLREFLPAFNTIPIEQGLAETVSWYNTHRQKRSGPRHKCEKALG
ncbi:MAG: NAD-dependent epimerase/dehydratase family protein [Chlamydiia bacterium]|nr:NAD-dependent epimerase/dehydratase family protein [Chlamydiia bacterium]